RQIQTFSLRQAIFLCVCFYFDILDIKKRPCGLNAARISKRNSTGNASWGVGPNIEAGGKSAYNNVQVGVGL
ncbi:hypothetical protein AAGX52_13305, partial [Staphylococcus aureus]